MKKNAKKLGMILGIVLVLASILYALFWFIIADRIKKEAALFVVEARQKNIHIVTRKLDVTGFPGVHEILFSGRIAAEGNIIEVPQLRVKSMLLSGAHLTIEAPEGLAIVEPAVTEIWSVNYLRLDTFIPESLPTQLTREDLTSWRQAGNKITIENIEIEKDDLKIKGNGTLELDKILQPAGTFTARATGHMDFLYWLQQKKYIETREGLLAAAVLSSLSKQEGDETYMDVALSLQNQTLFVGPLRLAYLPAIHWGWRSQPGLLEQSAP